MEVIVTGGDLSAEEQQQYEDYVLQKYPRLQIRCLQLDVSDDQVTISIEPEQRFVAKMGGCYIGDPLTWNDAKRAEYFDTLPNPL